MQSPASYKAKRMKAKINLAESSMASISVIYALSFLFLATAHGRTLASSNTSSTTNYYDVSGLMTLVNKFPQLYGSYFPLYTKDPCYPQKLVWITCSYDAVRRVTALNLDYYNLYGYLPDFSSMDALEEIQLQGNYLSGSIPEFLGNFPELTYLNLAYNDFSGALPYSLANSKRITLITLGNPRLCRSSYSCSPPAYSTPSFSNGDTSFDMPDMPKTKRGKFRLKFLYGLIPASLLVVLGMFCACCCPKKKKSVAVAATDADANANAKS